MKQHITKEQFDELSSKAQEKLREWSSKHCQIVYDKSNQVWYGDFLLSIGQMIEFLHDSHPDKRYKEGKSPTIGFHQDQFEVQEHEYAWWYLVPDELCDDLWEAVKKVLEEK